MIHSNQSSAADRDMDFGIDREKMRYIYKIMEKINSSNDIDVVGRDIVDIMANALDCIGGALLIVEEDKGILRPLTYSRINIFVEKVIPLLPKPFQDYLFDLKTHQNYTVRTVTEKRMFIGDRYEKFLTPVLSKFTAKMIQKAVGMKTIVTAPTIVEEKVLGILMIGFGEKELSEEKKNLMKLFSDQCAVAINNAQKYQKLQAQYQEMQEILAQQSDFISTSTHEIRTPLAAALFQAQDLENSLKNTSASELSKRQEEAKLVVKSLERLQNITEKIFAVHAYDAQKVKPHFLLVDLEDFCSLIHAKFKPLMEEKELKWTIQNDLPENFTFPFDPHKMEKMLTELITNAINFSKKNGKITLNIAHQNTDLYFKVIDTGEGIPEKERKNIFKKFKTNHSMRSMGIGLGLYIAQKIAELHQGDVWAENTPKGGATFVVKLPTRLLPSNSIRNGHEEVETLSAEKQIRSTPQEEILSS